MTLKETKLSTYSLVLAVATPCVLIAYGQIRQSLRPELDCSGQSNCVDLRGLNELPLLFTLWVVLSMVAVALAYQSYKHEEVRARIALWVSSLLAGVALLAIIIGLVSNN